MLAESLNVIFHFGTALALKMSRGKSVDPPRGTSAKQKHFFQK